MADDKKYITYTDDDDEEKDDLEGFLFFRQLEQNEGKVTPSMFSGGCVMGLPVLTIIVLAIFFFLTKMY
ncbi:MAG: hypothetical protein IIW34_01895 [Clostridia bacterium]|nr:hypothetical protein [Clostridia bacterium]